MNATTTRHTADSPDAHRYRAILQKKIDEGAKRAGDVITSIQRDQPKDQIVRQRAVGFSVNGALTVRIGEDSYKPTDFALGQIAGKAGVPFQYLRDLASPSAPAWQHALATDILSQHYGNSEETGRILARSVAGSLRGWLSDRYRRLDSRPLVDALAEESRNAGAVPCDGTATETRVAIKVLVPEILEPIPGEFLVYGGEWSNSDFGNGTHSFRTFALRVACLNGMTRENMLRQIHLGGRLGDEIEFSERTHRLDTAASVSALRDVVRGALGPASRDRTMQSIVDANAKAFSKGQLATATKALPKATAKAVADAFDSQDVINLPAGATAWRASNAISWIARHTADAEARLDLERAAGALV